MGSPDSPVPRVSVSLFPRAFVVNSYSSFKIAARCGWMARQAG